MFRVLPMLALVAAAVLASASAHAEPVRLVLDGRIEAPAGLFLTGLDKGFYAAESVDLSVEASSGSRDALSRVVAGTADVALADINTAIRVRDENPAADLRAVMIVYDRPTYALIGRRSRGVTPDPVSLDGKHLAATTTEATYQLWPLFKALNNVDDKAIRIETVGAPIREQMLAQGEVDAIFGGAAATAAGLRARGVPDDDLVEISMSEHGVELYGDALVVSAKWLAQSPTLTRNFLRATIRSVQTAAADPAAAIDSVMKRNDALKRDLELERLRLLIARSVLTPAVRENGLGVVDVLRMARSIDQLAQVLPFKAKPKAEDVFTGLYLPPAAEDRRLN